MWSEERLHLARLSYQRAVVRASAQPTPASWRRLLSAMRNVEDATRAGLRARARPERSASRPLVERIAALARLAPAARRGLTLVPALDAAPPSSAPRGRPPAAAPESEGTWLRMLAEWERSRRLIAEARRLVALAHQQRTELLALWGLGGSPPRATRAPR